MTIDQLRKICIRIFAVVLLFILWDTASVALSDRYGTAFYLPGVRSTLSTLWNLMKTKDYWHTILLSVLRITKGLFIGSLVGIVMAVVAYRFPLTSHLFSPFLTVVRSTPVVSFILILWLVLQNGKNDVPAFVAALMVIPVIYAQLHIGFESLDKNNMELLDLFDIRGKRKLKDFVLPSLLPHFFSAMLTSAGLAWKAGVSSEIIVYAAPSIGQKIKYAKDYLQGEEMYAWTLTVILFSVLFETVILRLKKEIVKHEY